MRWSHEAPMGKGDTVARSPHCVLAMCISSCSIHRVLATCIDEVCKKLVSIWLESWCIEHRPLPDAMDRRKYYSLPPRSGQCHSTAGFSAARDTTTHRLSEADDHLHAQAELGAPAPHKRRHFIIPARLVADIRQAAGRRCTCAGLAGQEMLTWLPPCAPSTGSRHCSRRLHAAIRRTGQHVF